MTSIGLIPIDGAPIRSILARFVALVEEPVACGLIHHALSPHKRLFILLPISDYLWLGIHIDIIRHHVSSSSVVLLFVPLSRFLQTVHVRLLLARLLLLQIELVLTVL